ncbi:MAG TPA: hypothetical protein VFM18_06990 [Methanosarcina sp.]|nr:hypothetical protein [Methanosarcina sp.]
MDDRSYEKIWTTYEAKCKCCGYEWQAVTTIYAEWLECPNCGKHCGCEKDTK